MPRLNSDAAASARERVATLEAELNGYKAEGLALDLTRGKPAADQLDLANELDGILKGDYRCADGTDARNYGALEGIPEMRALAAAYLEVPEDQVLIGGNSSLQLMYQYVWWSLTFGPDGENPWRASADDTVTFLCPVPGYDRHFALCEELGVNMIPVPMDDDGPDMDAVEALVRSDPTIRGMWCVPKYSNPSGTVYSDQVVERIAALGAEAHPTFRVLWDNAYAAHDLADSPPNLANIVEAAARAGTSDSIVTFGSFSKVTMAGAGISFLAASPLNLRAFSDRLSLMTIGNDKVNQLRHVRFFGDLSGIRAHMDRHRALLRPKFDLVQQRLSDALGGKDLGAWTVPAGGYFVSFDAPAGTASRIVELAGEHGVKLTPAGAAYPYGTDPDDTHIRLAPTFPPLDELDKAMRVFVACVELVALRNALGANA